MQGHEDPLGSQLTPYLIDQRLPGWRFIDAVIDQRRQVNRRILPRLMLITPAHDTPPAYCMIIPPAGPPGRRHGRVTAQSAATPTTCMLHTTTRSEEHTSNSSHVRISYAVFC